MCNEQRTAVGLGKDRERGETKLRDVRISLSLSTGLSDEE